MGGERTVGLEPLPGSSPLTRLPLPRARNRRGPALPRPAPRRVPARAGSPVLAALVVLALLGGAVAVPLYRGRHVRLPLLSAGVALGAGGALVPLPAGAILESGTRVLRDADPTAVARAARQRAWLAAGSVPGRSADVSLVRDALLDLDTLTLPRGALVAGWPQAWRYVWPRDASVAAAALATTGHVEDAVEILTFLQSVQPLSGVFQARYLPDGSGPPDGRGEQSDGTGLVLWATEQVWRHAPTAAARASVLRRLRPLVDRSASAALRLTAGAGALPPPSQDYWEVRDDRLSLGTAAPLAAGLAAAATLDAALGLRAEAERTGARARALYAAIDLAFGPDGYPRYLGTTQQDASVAFLLPPFRPIGGAAAVPPARPAVLAAWQRAALAMARPAGGLAPGAGWKDDGVSWTPETALFALTAASNGRADLAGRWLDWLRSHTTPVGALPEKVTSDGSPAGPAPLALTDALVILAAAALTSTRTPIPPLR